MMNKIKIFTPFSKSLPTQGPGDLGQTDIISHSTSTGDETPVWQTPPLTQKDAAQKTIQDMQQQGIVESSKSPWASPIIPVNKDLLRFCVDYQSKANNTKKNLYLHPRIESSLETLAGM